MTKVLRFIIFLIRNATFTTTKIDFEGKRKLLIGQFLPNSSVRSHRKLHGLKRLLMRYGLFSYLISNIADLKNCKSALRQFFVVDSMGLVYQRMFKNASISILDQLLPKIHSALEGEKLTDPQIDALSHYFVRNDISNVPESYECFAVVRDPFERSSPLTSTCLIAPATFHTEHTCLACLKVK